MCSLITTTLSEAELGQDSKRNTLSRSYGEVVDFVIVHQSNLSIDLPVQWHRFFLAQRLYRPLLQVVAHRHVAAVIPEIIFRCTRNDLCHTSPAIAAALMEPNFSESREMLSFHPRKVPQVLRSYADCIQTYRKSEPRS